MIFDVVTIFPEFFKSVLEHGLLKRALAGGHVHIRFHDLRDFTDGRHRTVDDRPFGGGPGMVLKPEPIFRAVDALKAKPPGGSFPVILLSPQGRLLKQAVAEELAQEGRVVLICGRYEGVDERVAANLATDELSIGDYVLSGGELAAAVVMEAVTRLLPGVLGNEESREQESFAPVAAVGVYPQERDRRDAGHEDRVAAVGACPPWVAAATAVEGPPGQDRRAFGERQGLLDFPQYTRPADFRGWQVPEVLLSGNHQQIRRWRRRQALLKTWRKRPDLLENLSLGEDERQMLDEIRHAAYEKQGLGTRKIVD